MDANGCGGASPRARLAVGSPPGVAGKVTMIAPVYCSCGPYLVCGGADLGCNPCEASVKAGISCGTRCSATPNRLRARGCLFCSGTLQGSVNSTGYYCDSCIASAKATLVAPLN